MPWGKWGVYHLQRNNHNKLRIKLYVVDLCVMHRVCQHSGKDISTINPTGFGEIHKKLFRFIVIPREIEHCSD